MSTRPFTVRRRVVPPEQDGQLQRQLASDKLQQSTDSTEARCQAPSTARARLAMQPGDDDAQRLTWAVGQCLAGLQRGAPVLAQTANRRRAVFGSRGATRAMLELRLHPSNGMWLRTWIRRYRTRRRPSVSSKLRGSLLFAGVLVAASTRALLASCLSSSATAGGYPRCLFSARGAAGYARATYRARCKDSSCHGVQMFLQRLPHLEYSHAPVNVGEVMASADPGARHSWMAAKPPSNRRTLGRGDIRRWTQSVAIPSIPRVRQDIPCILRLCGHTEPPAETVAYLAPDVDGVKHPRPP
ncbi:hypothetical protein ON010_g13576 [Phytophthora cinnamomi]|nr:hypothetical protein ON010_g13576 [Phytophthora cinnamomi]